MSVQGARVAPPPFLRDGHSRHPVRLNGRAHILDKVSQVSYTTDAMKLSTRSTYGMQALIELGLTMSRGPVPASMIAKQQDLSVAYLEQLLHRLKLRGIVSSVRGPKGGYCLAKDPDQISVGEIVRVLDGEQPAPNGKSKNGHRGPEGRRGRGVPHAQRIAHAVYRCVHERLTKSLEQVSLGDLCEDVRAHAQAPLDHRYVFHI